MQKYKLERKGLENNFGPSVKQSDKKFRMAAKIQDGCQFPVFVALPLITFVLLNIKSWFLVSTYVCMYD